MSRPFARLKLGYYPLPTEEAHNIHSLLVASGPYCAIDPCAGDGTALVEITRDTGAHLAAIEIDTDRAAGCIQRESQPFTAAHSIARCNRKAARFCTSILHTTPN